MIKYSTAATNGITARKTRDSLRSIVIAITAAPITRKGARTTSLISIATALWTWFTSFVTLVIRDGVPNLSSSAWEREPMCLNRSFLTTVPTPCEALEARYWHTSAQQSPRAPISIIMPPMR